MQGCLPSRAEGQQGPLRADTKLERCEGPSHKGQIDQTPAPGPIHSPFPKKHNLVSAVGPRSSLTCSQ